MEPWFSTQRSIRPSDPTWSRSGFTRRWTARSGACLAASHHATVASSAIAATPRISISMVPSRKLPTTSPSAAPTSDHHGG